MKIGRQAVEMGTGRGAKTHTHAYPENFCDAAKLVTDRHGEPMGWLTLPRNGARVRASTHKNAYCSTLQAASPGPASAPPLA